MSERVQWVDYAKGVGILLVIIGHTVSNPVIRGAIFSFHMPFFFILSGYTTKRANGSEDLKNRAVKTFSQLIIPAYVLWIIRLPFFYTSGRLNYSVSQLLLCALFASGSSFNLRGTEVPMFGMMWFLVTLFIVRNAYGILDYYLKGKYKTIICTLISLCGMILGQLVYLPFDLDIAMASMMFFHFGQILKGKEMTISLKKSAIAIFEWGGVLITDFIISHSYFEMVPRRYPIAPLSYIGAVAGSMACIYFCMYLNEFLPNWINHQMCLIGSQSILLFSIHHLDDIWYYHIQNHFNVVVLLLIRLLIDLLIFYIIYFCKKLYKTIESRENNV